VPGHREGPGENLIFFHHASSCVDLR
jgi:hypothetical protein